MPGNEWKTCIRRLYYILYFRVKGVDRLRVADAAIMPEITSANLNAPCLMIGEKAADLIRGREISSKL